MMYMQAKYKMRIELPLFSPSNPMLHILHYLLVHKKQITQTHFK